MTTKYISIHDVPGRQPQAFPDGLTEADIDCLFTALPGYVDGDKPVHGVNAGIEDKGHDWNVRGGKWYMCRPDNAPVTEMELQHSRVNPL